MAGTTFIHGEQTITVKTYVRSLTVLKTAIARSGLKLVSLEEKVVDESMRDHYERANMRDLFDRIKGVPIVYGMHLRKLGPGRVDSSE